MKALDWIFKMGLLIIGIAFVVVYFLSSQSGRYQYQRTGYADTTGKVLLDTKTGIQHRLEGETVLHMDFVNGKFTVDKIKREGLSAEEFLDAENEKK
jgi:hypothetical protein